MKILLLRLSSIGDCVLASPVLEALRERYPDAHLTWAVQTKSLPVVEGLPGLTETLVWRPDRGSYWRSLLPLLRRVRRERFDVALDLQGIDKAGLLSLASGAKRRISGTRARRMSAWFSNEIVPEHDILHARLIDLRRASALDIAPDAANRYFPRLPMLPAHRLFAEKFLREAGIEPQHRLIGLNLGASKLENRWGPRRFAELAAKLIACDARTRIIIFGAPADMDIALAFDKELKDVLGNDFTSKQARIISAVGRLDLLQLAGAIEHCAAFVTADTGPMHIAAAVGAPVLALFGPANVYRTGPVQNPGCAPVRVLDARETAGYWPAPMSALEVEPVFKEVQKLAAEVEAAGARPVDKMKVAPIEIAANS